MRWFRRKHNTVESIILPQYRCNEWRRLVHIFSLFIGSCTSQILNSVKTLPIITSVNNIFHMTQTVLPT